VGNYCHQYRRLCLSIWFALASVFLGSGNVAANPERVAVEVSFVESIEITTIDSQESGTSDQRFAITSSPGREFTILADPAGQDVTVSYQ
jgi:hypothetical protein